MQQMNNRDNFSERIKLAVAARAGWHCSLVGCTKLTVGPSEEAPDAFAKIGKAAHICAASPGGPSYDVSMTPEERAGIDNAMWLCSDHATLVDRDTVKYTADLLRAMKRAHEANCTRAMETGTGPSLAGGLLAIGPDVVCTGDLAAIDAESWTLSLKHFLIGDPHGIISFIDGFQRDAAENRYILSNDVGDGRVLIAPPQLTKQAEGYGLFCRVAPSAVRVDAQNIGSGLAENPEDNDLYLGQ